MEWNDIDKIELYKNRIVQLELSLDSYYTAQFNASLTSDLGETELDDGQTRVKTKYRNPNEINGSIIFIQQQINLYYQRLCGFGVYLRPHNRIYHGHQRNFYIH